MSEKTLIINSEKAHQKIERIAYEILENNLDEKEIILIGISIRGYKVAEKIFSKLKSITDQSISLQEITLDKEDVFNTSAIKFSGQIEDLNGKAVVVIDDVLNSGLTLMYAVRHLLSARIRKMSTAVLVDRKHRNYPIRADYAGLTLSTTLQEHIAVEFSGEEINVFLD